MKNPFPIFALSLLLTFSACSSPQKSEKKEPTNLPTSEVSKPDANSDISPPNDETVVPPELPLTISSSAFSANTAIPSVYSCDGKGVNPPLSLSNPPKAAKSLVLLVDDPDAPAGTWDHWILWNIDPTVSQIGENTVPANAVQGKNSSGTNGYEGPCPPSGTHRYFFKLYALDAMINLKEGSTKFDVEREMEGHIVASADIVGLYSSK
ncbi:YbhB/YbcL family Raf kinase inhibitor-like protein [Candidatus Peregrinibacteria bacterium]|nr:YbhB/YbcL family Raf kinase inhibitor-like protein [Candidatus Peregrinibacteria bacterium]